MSLSTKQKRSRDLDKEASIMFRQNLASLVCVAVFLFIILMLSSCSAVLDREAKSCYRLAYTTKDMSHCIAEFPPYERTLSDWVGTPVLELERKYMDDKRASILSN